MERTAKIIHARRIRARERKPGFCIRQKAGEQSLAQLTLKTSVVNILTSIVSILTGLAEFACNEPARRVHAYFALARIYPQPDIFLRNIGLREEKKKKKEKKKITDSCSFSLVSCTLSHAPFVRQLTKMPHRHLPQSCRKIYNNHAINFITADRDIRQKTLRTFASTFRKKCLNLHFESSAIH